MACIITYENKQYTQKEFEQYFKEHFTEFVDNFLGSKQDIEGFKEFVSKGQLFQKTATKSKPISKLEETLQRWFNIAGVQYNPVEDLEVNGEKVIARADTLRGILEVVEGRRDVTTLAEEAGHFLVEMLPQNHPILKAMMDSVVKTAMYDKVVQEYGEAYEFNEEKLRKEAVGKLIAQEVLKLESSTTESQSTKSKFTKFIDGVLNWIKARFKFLSSNDIYLETEAYKTAAELLLNTERTEELIDSGGLKKYDPNNRPTESDFMYQISNDALEIKKAIENNLDTKRAILVNDGYITPEGKSLARRVTSYVHEFYSKIFKIGNREDFESTYRKNKGIYIHKVKEVIINNALKGLPITESEVTKTARESLFRESPEIVEAYKELGNELWSLGTQGYEELKNGTLRLLREIKANSDQINRLTGLNEPFKIYTELSIYDETDNVAGTIDLLVLYPNGVVGIYDFKSMNFGFNKDISSTKIEAFQIQMDWYKRILVQNYGVKDFRESRIIPIEVNMNRDGKVYSVSESADYLKPIPIKEFTGVSTFDTELEKLYNYADKLRIKLRKNYQDSDTKVRLSRIENTIKSMLVNKELKFLDSEIQDTFDELMLRSSIDSASPEGTPITDVDINEMTEFVSAIKGVVSRFNETLGENPTKEQLNSVDILRGKISRLENALRDKAKELINKVNPEEDVDTPHKQIGFFARIFNNTFDLDSPIIRKVQKLIQNMSYAVVNDVNNIVDDITGKMNNLESWAKSRKMSLMDAYELLINDKTGNLVSKLSPEYYEEKRKMMELGGTKKTEWIKKYHTFDRALFKSKRKEREAFLLKEYPGTSKYRVRFRKLKLEEFDKKYNIDLYDSAISENNWFLKINEKAIPSNFFNEKWKFIHSKGNEALKEYYEAYIYYNEQFAAMTGKDINKTFIAEIRKDALNKALSNGIGSIFNVKTLFKELLEVHQEDAMLGSIDPVTGEAIPNIPLLYTGKLMTDLSKSELKSLEDEAAFKHKKGSAEYVEYLSSEVRKASRKKALSTKSHDLTRSLILFAKSAYTYKYLAESEAYVNNLKYYIQTNGGKTNLTDGSGMPQYNKFTNKVLTIIGVPESEVELLDGIINSVWYGKSMSEKDQIFNSKSLTDSEGNIIGNTTGFSRNKSIRNLMTYISVRALGLNPFTATGNYVGARANMWMLATEGDVIDKKSVKNATVRAYKDRKKYMAAVEILQPYPHNITLEIANNLSATKLEKILTLDNTFMLMKKPDEQVDRLLTNAMLSKYGLDANGSIRHLKKLPSGTKTLLDHLVEDDKGNWKFSGVSNEELSKFRVMIYKLANKIKGTTPDNMKAAYNRSLAGKVVMHFRGWMPGLISARFKDVTYDPDLELLDAGRFRVAWGEIFNSGGFVNGMKEFGKLLSEALITGYFNGGLKKINMEATKIAFEKFKLSNREQAANLTLEDFVEMRKAKLRGIATELRFYFLLATLMLLGKSAIPDKEEKDEALERFFARNAYLMANRGFLELSFFFQPSSIKQIIRAPIPSMQLLWDTESLIKNTVDETYKLFTGTVDERDRTPFGYYTTSRFIPFGKVTADIFDIYDSFQTK